MRWTKKGMIFSPAGQGGWINSHAQAPAVLVMEDRFRVYFTARPRQSASLPACVDLDRDDPSRVLRLYDRPMLDFGPVGSFDEHGIMPSCVVDVGGVVHLYYVGWSRKESVPYSWWVGLATSTDGGLTFTKHGDAPIVDRAPGDIHTAAGFFVVPHGGRFLAWYSSGKAWVDVDGKLEHIYRICSAESDDGVHWRRNTEPLLPTVLPEEINCRESVVFHDGRWHMWFSYRGCRDFRGGVGSYRIGYASSTDLSAWVRDDAAAGIGPSAQGWDSTMIAYPYVVRAGDRLHMFYNGNDFGRNGFGYAVLDD